MKNPIIITMLVIAVLLIGGVLAVVLVFNVFDREVTPAPTLAPAPAVPAPAPAPPALGIEDKLKTLQQVIEQVKATGQPQEVTIVLTEAEVNTAATQSLTQSSQSGDFKVLSVRIDLKPGNEMLAELQAQALGFTIPIKVVMNIGVKDGKPAVTVTSVNFGMLPVPQSLKDQITIAIAQNMDNLMAEMTQSGVGAGVAYEFRSVTVRETDMTIVALLKPA